MNGFVNAGIPMVIPRRDGKGSYEIQPQRLGRIDFVSISSVRESYGQARRVGRIRCDAGSLRALIAALQAFADEVT